MTPHAIVDWIDRFHYHRFVTLAFNSGHTPITQRRYFDPLAQVQLLRAWDARVNHKLLGKRWARDRLHRIWYFAIMEKPVTNPHWHLLLRFDGGPAFQAEHEHLFDAWAGRLWSKLVLPGSIDIQKIYDRRGAVDYTLKTLGYHLSSWDTAIVPDQL
jgi:hypothetical protein